MTRALALALCAALLACAWLYYSLDGERTAHATTREDNARLLASVAAHKKTISGLRGELKTQSELLAKRDASIAKFNEAALDAAIAIQGASNDSPECNIDAALPASLSQPLRLLHSQAAGSDHSAARAGIASGLAVPAKADTGATGGNDTAQPGTMDSQAHAVGK